LYHFPVGISRVKTFLTVSPGQTKFDEIHALYYSGSRSGTESYLAFVLSGLLPDYWWDQISMGWSIWRGEERKGLQSTYLQQ
jgi:hypothetical protein